MGENQSLNVLEGVHNYLQGKWLVSQPLHDLHPWTERACVILEWMAMVDRDAILILLLQSKL